MDNIELVANILPPAQKGNNFINITNNGSTCHFLFVNASMKIGVILNSGTTSTGKKAMNSNLSSKMK